MLLPADTSRCTGKDCPLAPTCRRTQTDPRQQNYYYTPFWIVMRDTGACAHHIPVED